jgi:hypothetical protein
VGVDCESRKVRSELRGRSPGRRICGQRGFVCLGYSSSMLRHSNARISLPFFKDLAMSYSFGKRAARALRQGLGNSARPHRLAVSIDSKFSFRGFTRLHSRAHLRFVPMQWGHGCRPYRDRHCGFRRRLVGCGSREAIDSLHIVGPIATSTRRSEVKCSGPTELAGTGFYQIKVQIKGNLIQSGRLPLLDRTRCHS